ncbi:unnamed protein product [Rotaria socialis]|uniref:triacylglycerol lipase n=3 Tax=Rotaria socialis TaxID=392032 RepID=A0A818XQJ1_9BILA|nr:unnamed protein product [Rotaria socialis]CAF3288826.1 unnamed protein product [Rotaria socialis]CAF3739970.1 unnamed protein product [Rotaria socialis]
MIIKSNPSSINLSLCGCGFLGVYHIGVVCAFKEHTPQVLDRNKMAGCSAGSLVAACALSGCCLGQMCSDALEIAIRARSRALGPLHPTFNIVDIIRNGLRRILPPNAHEICSGRLFISLTRWKDNKNVIINQFKNREELIQVLICSSFVPYWSGIIPPKFRGEYYWDGTLTNNNPIIDEETVLVSPFAGENDICPRNESGSFYSIDIRGTDISCTQENFYRLTHALFPPNLSVLKEICWRGYIDGLKFLQIRSTNVYSYLLFVSRGFHRQQINYLDMIKSSDLTVQTTISSALGCDYTEPADQEEKQLGDSGFLHDVDQMFAGLDAVDDEQIDYEYTSDELNEELAKETSQTAFSVFCEKVTRKKDLPTPVFAVFADAIENVEGSIGCYFTESNLYRLWLLLTLPITLLIELIYAAVKRILGLFVPSSSSNQFLNRLLNFVWSFFGDNDDDYCYHVNDCECTDICISSNYQQPGEDNFRIYQRQTSAPMDICVFTSNESNPFSDDEELSQVNRLQSTTI